MNPSKTKRVAWLTDLHLNFVEPVECAAFLNDVADTRPQAVLISGDIAEAHDVTRYLSAIADRLAVPIYFVLGNHDYYRGSFRQVHHVVRQLCQRDPRLVWLTDSKVVELAPRVGLVGHDGWADARLGDYLNSEVMLNDYFLIEELAGFSTSARWPVLQALADEAAATVARVLPTALERYPHVALVTHVPPFREACWHDGEISNDEWLPHFTSKAMGEVLLRVMADYPNRELTVLCGHTHGRGESRPAKNIHVLTGGAVYCAPEIQRVFEFPLEPK